MKRALGLALCLAPQFLLVAAVAAREELRLRRGVEVRLDVRSVDPFSPMAGRYLHLPLAIERLSAPETRIEAGLAPGTEVCVRLAPGEPAWSASEVSREPPLEGSAIFLRGRWMGENRVEYLLDTFYIPADGADPSALSWNRSASEHALLLLLRVSADGRASIEDLLVRGQPYAQWNAAQKRR